MEQKRGPWVVIAACCKSGRGYPDGGSHISLTEVFGVLEVPGLPYRHLFGYVLLLAADEAQGEHFIEAQLKSPTGQVVQQLVAQRCEFIGLNGGTQIVANVSTVFQQSGIYWIEATCDGWLVARTPIEIRLQS